MPQEINDFILATIKDILEMINDQPKKPTEEDVAAIEYVLMKDETFAITYLVISALAAHDDRFLYTFLSNVSMRRGKVGCSVQFIEPDELPLLDRTKIN